jgi:hypothetical protein
MEVKFSFSLRLLADRTKKILKRGGPNISVRLACFQANRLLTELYKQETQILGRKDDGNIKKTDTDRHGLKPSSNSCQPPDPPNFSLVNTFKQLLVTK